MYGHLMCLRVAPTVMWSAQQAVPSATGFHSTARDHHGHLSSAYQQEPIIYCIDCWPLTQGESCSILALTNKISNAMYGG